MASPCGSSCEPPAPYYPLVDAGVDAVFDITVGGGSASVGSPLILSVAIPDMPSLQHYPVTEDGAEFDWDHGAWTSLYLCISATGAARMGWAASTAKDALDNAMFGGASVGGTGTPECYFYDLSGWQATGSGYGTLYIAFYVDFGGGCAVGSINASFGGQFFVLSVGNPPPPTTGSGGGTQGGGGSGTPPPSRVDTNLEILHHRIGFYMTGAGDGIRVQRAWHPDLLWDMVSQVDPDPTGAAPSLCMMTPGEGIAVLYRTGDASETGGSGFYLAFSWDWAQTWTPFPPVDPDTAQKVPLLNNVNRARMVFCQRSNEYMLLFNDNSDTDSNGNPTGMGFMKCQVIGSDGSDQGTFDVDKSVKAADMGFDCREVRDANDSLRLIFIDSNGTLRHYISTEDGRSWSDITSQFPASGSTSSSANTTTSTGTGADPGGHSLS